MSEDRRLAVLRAIIQDYVHTSEPVGSKALLERHQLGVSAATVRNDMASLEEDGLIAAPHTSAGRIPTDAGYRLFVNGLNNLKPLSSAERRAIRQLLDGAVDLDDILDRTVRLLASLTRQVAVVQYPSLTRSSVRHIELVPIDGARLLVVLITTQGRVEQRTIDCGVDLASANEQELLNKLRTLVNTVTVGRTLADAAASLGAQLGAIEPQIRSAYAATVGTLAEMLVEQRDERVVMSGTSNLLRSGTDFATSIGPVLEALEEQVVLLKLLSAMADAPDAVAVSIGAENGHTGLQSASLVSTQYGDGAAGLGVVGPTRMDYPTTMATVRAVATYVSRILAE